MWLSGKAEFYAEAEVLRGGGIAAAGEQGRIGLAVVIKAHGEHAAQRVVGRKTEPEGGVAAAGGTG